MPDKFLKLDNAPIILAVVEILYDAPDGTDISSIKKNDSDIRKIFQNRKENLSGSIKMPAPIIGEGTVRFSSKYEGFTYQTEDGENAVDIGINRIGYKMSGKYESWSHFKECVITAFNLFSFFLDCVEIRRVSVRFINSIAIDEKIDKPSDYFNVFISENNGVIKCPVSSFSFRYSMLIDGETIANVAHSLDEKIESYQDYILDIDILSSVNNFSLSGLPEKLDFLKKIEHEIFFSSLTEKTKGLL